jgi:hypothetical protein
MKPTIAQLCLLLVLLQAVAAQAELFRTDSKQYGPTKMDIVISETERRPRSSLIKIIVTNPGSSVGSSFFLLCSLRNLGRERGYPRYIAKAENFPADRIWLVAFLNGPTDDPKQTDPQLEKFGGSLPVIDLDQFAPICDRMNEPRTGTGR